eukprot:SAG11_NODE_11212_length_776_cov_1.067947_1_plen_156_part_10
MTPPPPPSQVVDEHVNAEQERLAEAKSCLKGGEAKHGSVEAAYRQQHMELVYARQIRQTALVRDLETIRKFDADEGDGVPGPRTFKKPKKSRKTEKIGAVGGSAASKAEGMGGNTVAGKAVSTPTLGRKVSAKAGGIPTEEKVRIKTASNRNSAVG